MSAGERTEASRRERAVIGAARRLFAALRPRQWAHFTVLPLAGLDLALPATESAVALGRGLAIATCVLAYGYLLNALSDRELDRSREKNPLVGLAGPARALHGVAALLAVLALALAATGPRAVLLATAVALGSGAVYSAGPRLKAWPGIGTLLNVGCFTPLVFVGLARGPIYVEHLALAGLFSGLLLQSQLVHEAADADEDRAGRVRTTFLVAGARASAALALLAGLFGAATASPLAPSWLWLAPLALPFLTLLPWALLRHGEDPARMRRARRVHRLASAVVGALAFALLLTAH